MKILLVHTSGIGDWLFFTPALRAIRCSFPEATIEAILGTPATKQIVDLYSDVQVRDVADVRHGAWRILGPTMRTWFSRYDALMFTANVNGQKADRLAGLIRATEKIALLPAGFRRKYLTATQEYDWTVHLVENNIKLARLLGATGDLDLTPYLPVERVHDEEPEPGSVLIHPGCEQASLYRRWPVERFAAVAEALIADGRRVGVILGPSEVDLRQAFAHLELSERFSLHINLPLRELVRTIARYEQFLNSDSGLGHIAAALGRRTVSLFGPADPGRSGPFSPRAAIIRSSRQLDCRPCIRPGGQNGCAERPCLLEIDWEDVLAIVRNRIPHNGHFPLSVTAVSASLRIDPRPGVAG